MDRAQCPTCRTEVTVLPTGWLAFHYGHGPGMGIPCPPAQPPAAVEDGE